MSVSFSAEAAENLNPIYLQLLNFIKNYQELVKLANDPNRPTTISSRPHPALLTGSKRNGANCNANYAEKASIDWGGVNVVPNDQWVK